MKTERKGVDVLAVMRREEDQRHRDLRRLDEEIATGNVIGYEKEHADLTRWHREASEARAAVAELLNAIGDATARSALDSQGATLACIDMGAFERILRAYTNARGGAP